MNKQVIQDLLKEKQRLEAIIAEASAFISNAPEGTVQIRTHNDHLQFFHRQYTHEKNGKYIPVAERDLALSLVQKRYMEHILKEAQNQLKTICAFLNQYDPDILINTYLKEGKYRKGLLDPVELPDDEFAALWQAQTYDRKGFQDNDPEHYTQKNERVRSKSEVLIADALNQAGIPYHYERPLRVRDRIIYPDLTLLRITDREELYWEHHGMMDDIDYCNHALQRIRDYESIGIYPGDRLIITMETSLHPLNKRIINQIIRHYILQE